MLDDIENGITIKLPEQNIDQAWKKLLKLNTTQGLLKRKLTIIDLRFPNKVIVKLGKMTPDERKKLKDVKEKPHLRGTALTHSFNRLTTIAALDIGSSKVCCLIAKISRDKKINVVGYGYNASKGIKKRHRYRHQSSHTIGLQRRRNRRTNG